jgi:alpha-amylase
MTRRRFVLMFALLILSVGAPCPAARAQSGFDDGRVMIQGFYWESHRHGDPAHPEYGTKKWYTIIGENAEKLHEARFDLIWLPPPSYAGTNSAGYNPKELYRLDNWYGSFDQHRAMLEALLKNGVEPVADIVINHRAGLNHWADLKNPDWSTKAITADDEAFFRPESEVNGTPLSERGAPEESNAPYGAPGARDYAYDIFRDIDHTNKDVRKDLIRYLLLLKGMGYRGWRYDMAHGFHARHVALYNKRTQPTFSVGEYDWGRQGEWRGWSLATATTPGDLKTASNVFDFTTMFALKDNKTRYAIWGGYGHGLGLMGDTTDGVSWKQRAVTFLENHDTGYRTGDDGTPEPGHTSDSFANNWEVEQGYAYILTHPGVPCVYWKHYFDWSDVLTYRIRALINARKVAGVHSGSMLFPQDNARSRGVYAARVDGSRGTLYVRVGGSDNDWQPSSSDYRDYREYAYGAGWKVWISLPGNPDFVQASLNPPLPIPTFKPATEIDVPDEWAAE